MITGAVGAPFGWAMAPAKSAIKDKVGDAFHHMKYGDVMDRFR